MDINITNPVTTAKIGEVVNGASAATPNDTDLLPVIDTSVAKKLTLTNLKAFLKTYFDTLYTGGSAAWGSITGTLSNQTDLQTALNTKEPLKGADDNYVTDAQLVVIGNTSNTNTGDETAARIGAIVNGATNYVTPLDADKIGIWDTFNSLFKSVTWANLKATLASTFYLDATSSIQTQLNSKGYFNSGYFHALINLADSTNYYVPYSFVSNITSSQSIARHKVLKSGTAVNVEWMHSVVVGSNEAVTLYINNITISTLVQVTNTIDMSVATANLSFTGISFTYTIGDVIELYFTTPAWVTNPTSTRFCVGCLFI